MGGFLTEGWRDSIAIGGIAIALAQILLSLIRPKRTRLAQALQDSLSECNSETPTRKDALPVPVIPPLSSELREYEWQKKEFTQMKRGFVLLLVCLFALSTGLAAVAAIPRLWTVVRAMIGLLAYFAVMAQFFMVSCIISQDIAVKDLSAMTPTEYREAKGVPFRIEHHLLKLNLISIVVLLSGLYLSSHFSYPTESTRHLWFGPLLFSYGWSAVIFGGIAELAFGVGTLFAFVADLLDRYLDS